MRLTKMTLSRGIFCISRLFALIPVYHSGSARVSSAATGGKREAVFSHASAGAFVRLLILGREAIVDDPADIGSGWEGDTAADVTEPKLEGEVPDVRLLALKPVAI